MANDLDRLAKQDISKMTIAELTAALRKIRTFKNADKDSQLKVIRAILRYKNVRGKDLTAAIFEEFAQDIYNILTG